MDCFHFIAQLEKIIALRNNKKQIRKNSVGRSHITQRQIDSSDRRIFEELFFAVFEESSNPKAGSFHRWRCQQQRAFLSIRGRKGSENRMGVAFVSQQNVLSVIITIKHNQMETPSEQQENISIRDGMRRTFCTPNLTDDCFVASKPQRSSRSRRHSGTAQVTDLHSTQLSINYIHLKNYRKLEERQILNQNLFISHPRVG
jgi:hypothetical protein